MTDDILERIGATKDQWGDQWNLLEEAAEEIERLRERESQLRGFANSSALIAAKLEAEVERLRSEREVWIKHYNDVLEANARIKELEEANRNIDKRRDEMAAFIERLEAAFLEAKRCPTCNGAGKLIDVVISRKLGRVESERVCPLCEGKWEEKAREALEKIRAGGKDE